MAELLWRALARILSTRFIAAYLVRRAQRTPYTPIYRQGDDDIYMHRWWLFNPYGKDGDGNTAAPRWPWLPSIRVHHILRADDDAHLHDHPWNARTIVLANMYEEERPRTLPGVVRLAPGAFSMRKTSFDEPMRDVFLRTRGYTGRVLFGQYHRISYVPNDGVYTLWFTWRYQGTWGFLVDGKKVPYREYLQ